MNESQAQAPGFLPDPIFVFFIGFLLIIYFMSIRPQQKKNESTSNYDG
jgi:preprotein translocase subunit YajC